MPRPKMLQIPSEYAGMALDTLEREGQAKIEEGKRLCKLAADLRAGHNSEKKKPRKSPAKKDAEEAPLEPVTA